MSLSKSFLFCITALSIAACDTAEPLNTGVNEIEKTFLLTAADIGLFYINAGQTASANSTTPSFVTFGESISSGQVTSNTAFKIISDERGIPVPTTLSPERQLRLDSLSARKGVAYDTLFPTLLSRQLSSDIRYFESELPESADKDIKSWTDIQLAMLRSHLQVSAALIDSLN